MASADQNVLTKHRVISVLTDTIDLPMPDDSLKLSVKRLPSYSNCSLKKFVYSNTTTTTKYDFNGAQAHFSLVFIQARWLKWEFTATVIASQFIS